MGDLKQHQAWNIERLKHLSEQNSIRQHCFDADADILVLTESILLLEVLIPMTESQL